MAATNNPQATSDTLIESGPALRLSPGRDPQAPIPFDRRESPRMNQMQRGMAILSGGSETDLAVAIAPVSIQDASSEGIGMISEIEPKLGQLVRLMIPGASYDGASGRVVRVNQAGDVWRVGLRIRRRMAA